MTGCDNQLFDVLTRTGGLVGHRGGWLRLVGLGPMVLDGLEGAGLPEVLMVYRASDWARHAHPAGPVGTQLTEAWPPRRSSQEPALPSLTR